MLLQQIGGLYLVAFAHRGKDHMVFTMRNHKVLRLIPEYIEKNAPDMFIEICQHIEDARVVVILYITRCAACQFPVNLSTSDLLEWRWPGQGPFSEDEVRSALIGLETGQPVRCQQLNVDAVQDLDADALPDKGR